MIALLRTEVVKQARRPRTWVALGLMAAVPIIITFALWANPPQLSQDGGTDNLFYLATHSGLYLPAAIMMVMSRFLLIMVAALFAGDAIASEASWGNLRAMLARPIRRERLLGVKFSISLALAFLATLIIVVTALVAGVIAFGSHPLQFPAGLSSFAPPTQSVGTLLGHLGIAGGYIAWSLVSIVAFGFMISTMTDSPAGAGSAAFGLYITSSILDNIKAVGVIRNVFPTHYIDAWQSLFTQNAASSDLARGALLQVGYLVVFGSIAWWYFRRKDIMS
jgi:ABC-2 type transport system permease protein